MINVHNITKRYGNLLAVDNVSFQLEKGDVLGFLGPNGAGKTTTMRIITGYMPPSKGTVYIGNVDIFENPLEAKKQLGYLPENPPLYSEMIVKDYLDFVAEIKGVSGKFKSQRISYVLDQCGIGDVRKRVIAHLSKGYKQRVGIAQALINDPSVLVLDEPTNGLDPMQIIEIRRLIKSLASHRTVILSTHILPEVTMICSKVIIINEGKIALEQSLEKLSEKLSDTQKYYLKIKHNGEGVKEKLLSLKEVSDVKTLENKEFVIEPRKGAVLTEKVAEIAMKNKWGLVEVRPVAQTLEEIFLKVISSE